MRSLIKTKINCYIRCGIQAILGAILLPRQRDLSFHFKIRTKILCLVRLVSSRLHSPSRQVAVSSVGRKTTIGAR